MKTLMILGIDIGGTGVKFGLVSPQGDITEHKKLDTRVMVKEGFAESLAKTIKEYLTAHPDIKGVGIGFPGLLSVDRKKVIFLPNIPEVKDMPVVNILKEKFPDLTIKIENDAKCATMGEYYFGDNKGTDNFMLVALGTGVGSGAIINQQLFLGARGNGMEIGHMLGRDGKTLEQHIGLASIIAYAKEILKDAKDTKLDKDNLGMHALCDAAAKGDIYAKKVFTYVGTHLGEHMVSVIRVLDLDNILIGGGISAAFDYILPAMESVILKNLPPYYTNALKIKKAWLSNDAGLLGAAGLIMHEHRVFADTI
jgi:glucokinase